MPDEYLHREFFLRPIADAPKDRRIILVCMMGDHPWIAYGGWDDRRYVKNPRPLWRSHEMQALWGALWMRTYQPTHWIEPDDLFGRGDDE